MLRLSLPVLLCLALPTPHVQPVAPEDIGPGVRTGVVLFDRWDGCALVGGRSLLHVAEAVKESLRNHAGEAIVLDATKVIQPINPGGARIAEFKVLRPADPQPGLSLAVSVATAEDGWLLGEITVKNSSSEPIRLRSADIAVTLLAKRGKDDLGLFCPSDGPSFAPLKGICFAAIRSGTGGWAVGEGRYRGAIAEESALPSTLELAAGKQRKLGIRLQLPDGQYDIVASAGQRSLSSPYAFDLADGKIKAVARQIRSDPKDTKSRD